MARRVKWGIMSTANIAQKQIIPAIQSSSNSEVQAISSNSGREQEVAAKFAIPNTYRSHEELLKDEAVEVVYIPLPNSLHAEWCIKAAQAGKHILCEKPIALTRQEFKAIEKACRDNQVYFMEAFMYRFHPQHQQVKDLLVSQEIGRVLSIRSRFHFTVAEPEQDIRMRRDLGGGVTYDIGCYSVNLLNFLLDSKPVRVSATTITKQVDTQLAAILEYENDVLGIIDSSFQGPLIHEYEVTGTRGVIRVPYAFRPDLHEDVGVVHVQNEQGEHTFRYKQAQYVAEVEHLAAAILTKQALAYTPVQAYEQMVTLEAVLKSAESRQVINI